MSHLFLLLAGLAMERVRFSPSREAGRPNVGGYGTDRLLPGRVQTFVKTGHSSCMRSGPRRTFRIGLLHELSL
jgi:hypothetical protein